MGVRQNMSGSHTDSELGTFGQKTVVQDFSEISSEKSFLYKNIVRTGWFDRPDGRTSATSNFHNRLRTSGP
jgi:hypothetical protein